MNQLYNHDCYKPYLRGEFSSERWGVGARGRLAKALACQASFVSRILNKEDHFTLEQAYKVAKFLNLGPHETEYFMTLVLKARAGDHHLSKYYDNRLDEQRRRQWDLSQVIKKSDQLSEAQAQKYYSSWYFAAIHVAVGIDGLSTVAELSKKLRLEEGLVKQALDFLVEAELVIDSGTQYFLGKRRIHLPSFSPYTTINHSAWRLKIVDLLLNAQKGDEIHYSSVLAISNKAVEPFRNLLVKTISDAEKLLAIDGADQLVIFNLDLRPLN